MDDYFVKQPEVVSRDLKLERFAFSLRFAPWPFPDAFKVEFSNVLYRSIFQIIAEAKIPKASLTFTSPEKALEINRTRGEGTTGWFGIGYQEPGKSFGITVNQDVFQIRCDGIRLNDLVNLAKNIFSHITAQLVSPMLAEPAMLQERVHTVDYTFVTQLRLGADKVQQKPVLNYELLSKALSLDRKPSGNGQKSIADALLAIGPERFVRMDFTQHALKILDGHMFNTGFALECPYNENNSIVQLLTFVRAEEEFGLDLVAALNWETALQSFFRDIVLKRFLDNLFCSTHYSNA